MNPASTLTRVPRNRCGTLWQLAACVFFGIPSTPQLGVSFLYGRVKQHGTEARVGCTNSCGRVFVMGPQNGWLSLGLLNPTKKGSGLPPSVRLRTHLLARDEGSLFKRLESQELAARQADVPKRIG